MTSTFFNASFKHQSIKNIKMDHEAILGHGKRGAQVIFAEDN